MKVAAAACALLVSLACASPAAAAVARNGQVVMGTVLTVTVVAADRAAAEAMANDAIEEARRWDDALTIWSEDGELASFNARAGQGAIAVGPRLARGLAAMLALANETGGAFEPAVVAPSPAAPVRVRGIRQVLSLHLASAEAGSGATAPRTAAAIEKGSALDPGGIGKGLALDAIISLLRGRGATAAFADFGGSSQAALGAAPGDARGWTVLLGGLGMGSDHGVLHLRDGSLSTSRAGAVDTKPILDPLSGMAVRAPRMVSVRGADATSADAWSTALVVLGRDGMAAATGRGLDVLMEDPSGTMTNPGWEVATAGSATAGSLENESQVP